MASHSGKKPKPVHVRVWEKLRADSMCTDHIISVDEAIRFGEDKCK